MIHTSPLEGVQLSPIVAQTEDGLAFEFTTIYLFNVFNSSVLSYTSYKYKNMGKSINQIYPYFLRGDTQNK